MIGTKLGEAITIVNEVGGHKSGFSLYHAMFARKTSRVLISPGMAKVCRLWNSRNYSW